MSTFLPRSLVCTLAVALSSIAARAVPFDGTVVEIVEFTDYQCPYCGLAESTIADLQAQYGPAIRVLVKHQPLAFHPNARRAAEAAEAARNQARFEAMHARLFANQLALGKDDILEHARAVGLDLERFKRDLASPEVKARVDRDRAIGNAVGATGTPTFFINGRLLKGAQPVEQFKALIDQEIAEARRLNRRGDAWLSDRLNVANPALWGYLRGGQIPPADAEKKSQATAEAPADKTIYKVAVDPAIDAYDGPGDALVTMVEFLDYQCPFCRKLEATMGELMSRYPGKIRRVVKHLPLTSHLAARPAAAAAICAQAQGRFWQMHDGLYADPRNLEAPAMRSHAASIGLDLPRFERCLAAPATEARIAADMALAEKVGARGTPTSFINGRQIMGARPLESFTALIDEELARAQALLATGVRPKELYGALIRDGKTLSALGDEVFRFADRPRTPILGSPRARVRVTVFADLQCPFSARLFPVLKELEDRYRGKVAVAWKHFPLEFHQSALPAAKSAACALDQKKFWPAVERLFAQQSDLTQAIGGLPEAIGVDAVKYLSCMNRDAHGADIDADLAEGRRAGVDGTPTVFIQGRKVDATGGHSLESLSRIVDALLAGRAP